MKFITISIFLIIFFANSALASTDWTPLVKSMQKSCSYDAIKLSNSLKKIPSKYKSSVVSNKVINDNGYLVRTIHLKNAKAFGHSLKAIEIGYPIEGSGDHITLYFSNKNFLKLKSSFYYDVNGVKVYAGKQQTLVIPSEQGEDYLNISPNGYEVGDITSFGLQFDANKKSITCYVDA